MIITEEIAQRVLTTVDKGLIKGLGTQVPGRMCVEAAVCFALGLPHSDNPPCVGSSVRAYKIRLNDSLWSSDDARARGMRRVAIAQLGSNKIDQARFTDYVIVQGVKRILSRMLRKRYFIELAEICESVSDRNSARDAAKKSHADAAAAYAAAYAYAYADAAAYAAAAAAYAAAAYAAAAAAAAIDEILSLAAEIAVEALQEQNCEGCAWLYLCDHD